MTAAAQDNTPHSSEEEQRQNDSRQPNPAMIEMSPKFPSPPPSAKDRGYAWVVVGAVFWINTLCAGYIKSFGITYLLLLEYFPDASGASAGWIMGLLVGTRGLLAPLMGALSVKIGPRRSVLAGTLLVILGLLLAIPTFSIFYMAVTLGGLVGIGISMSETPGILMVTDYFVEKRSLANGIRAAGNSMGGILFSPMLVFLKDQFGLQGTFILLAGIMMHIAVFGMLMRPLELQEQILHHQHLRKTHPTLECVEDNSEKAQAVTHKPFPKKALHFTLLKDPNYLLYLVMALFVNLPLPQCLLYLPTYGRSVGLTNYQNSTITAYLSGIDCISRLLCGFLVHKFQLNENYVFIAGLVGGGVGCLLVTVCSTMWQLMLASTLYALGLAVYWALINTLLANHFGAESMASSYGFYRMTQGITGFVYPSLLGWVKDLTGSLVVPYLIMGAGFILGGLIFCLQPLVAKISKTREK